MSAIPAPRNNKPAAPAQSTGGAHAVALRNEFYVDQYRRAITVNIILSIGLVLSAGLNVYFATNPTQHKYFATTADGKVLPISPLDEPSMDAAALLAWASRAAVKPYNFDFVNYRTQLTGAATDFTTDGYKQLLAAFGQRNIIDYVTKKQLIVGSQPAAAAVISAQGALNGVYAWQVQVPINVTFQGGPERVNATQPLLVTMTIVRVPTRDNPDGLGVNQYIVSSR